MKTPTSRTRRNVALSLVVAVALVTVAATSASGSRSSATVLAAHNSPLSQTIVVGAHGRTLYALLPETTHHLLCTSSACLSAWPPYTVASAHARLRDGGGVHGTLGLIHRDHVFQVTLRGHPLYRYAGDSANGQANGQRLQSFGGTWHVLVARGGVSDRSLSSQHTSVGGGW